MNGEEQIPSDPANAALEAALLDERKRFRLACVLLGAGVVSIPGYFGSNWVFEWCRDRGSDSWPGDVLFFLFLMGVITSTLVALAAPFAFLIAIGSWVAATSHRRHRGPFSGSGGNS